MWFNFSGGNVDPETKQIRNLQTARFNFLLVAVFTIINVILALIGGDYYFLFSSFIPYYLTFIAVFMEDTVLIAVMIVVAALFIAFYFLCWWMSKNKPKLWMSVALAVFAVDTVFLFIICRTFLMDMIVDIVFHVWVIVYLIIGIIAASKLKKMAAEAQSGAECMQPEESVEDYAEAVEGSVSAVNVEIAEDISSDAENSNGKE